MRREYEIKSLLINNKVVEKLIVDPHVDKHSDHIDDELIKNIVTSLNGGQFCPVKEEDGFSYFATNIKYKKSWYRLIWLLEDNSLYIGVITAFKDRRIKWSIQKKKRLKKY